MREFKYGVGVVAPNFLLNLLLVKMSQKSLTKPDFWGKNQKDMSDNGTHVKIIFISLVTHGKAKPLLTNFGIHHRMKS